MPQVLSTNCFKLADIYVRLGLLLLSSIQEDVCRIFNTSDYTAYYSRIEEITLYLNRKNIRKKDQIPTVSFFCRLTMPHQSTYSISHAVKM